MVVTTLVVVTFSHFVYNNCKSNNAKTIQFGEDYFYEGGIQICINEVDPQLGGQVGGLKWENCVNLKKMLFRNIIT